MKRIIPFLVLLLIFCGCGKTEPTTGEPAAKENAAINIQLDDNGITLNGSTITGDDSQAVYAAKDIVYYPTGKDFTFGEGDAEDAHDAAEADKHTVVHITKPGTYRLSGKLSAGQIAVDLGSGAKKDPKAVVNLILDNVDITCSVAPAVIFYNVYECGDKDHPQAQVNTAAAGANVVLSDNSVNNIQGAYVARIYKPDSVELNDAGTKVTDSKKLHKYDAAFYSKMSMNIDGTNGILNIQAENEGLDSEMHLTINGGDIRINSGNDGINTNEDGVSVTTVNGGSLIITVDGSTGEGDGIDSNGWLVINGGYVMASACGFSMDSGIDSDMGVHINGGTVIASGNMLDRISQSQQNYAIFNFAQTQKGGSEYTLTDNNGKSLSVSPANDFTSLIISTKDLTSGEYAFTCDGKPLAHSSGQSSFDRPGGMMPPEGFAFPGGEMTPPDGMEFPQGGMMPPDGMEFPQGGMTPPDGIEFPPNGSFRNGRDRNEFSEDTAAENTVFTLTDAPASFYGVSLYTA